MISAYNLKKMNPSLSFIVLEKHKTLKQMSRAHFIKVKEGEETKGHINRWVGWLIEDTKKWGGMTDARVLTVCRAATLQLEKLNIVPPTENNEQVSPEKKALRERSYRAAEKLENVLGEGWRETVSNYLNGCPRDTLSAMIPD